MQMKNNGAPVKLWLGQTDESSYQTSFNYETTQAMYALCNIEESSCSHWCSGKAI